MLADLGWWILIGVTAIYSEAAIFLLDRTKATQ